MNLSFVKPDMRRGCESKSVELGGNFLKLLFSCGRGDRIIKQQHTEGKDEWKKMYLNTMKENGIIGAQYRHAYQVLYGLSRHYEVCTVKDDTIIWTCTSVEELELKLKVGQLRSEMEWVYGELNKARNEIKHLKRAREEGECF